MSDDFETDDDGPQVHVLEPSQLTGEQLLHLFMTTAGQAGIPVFIAIGNKKEGKLEMGSSFGADTIRVIETIYSERHQHANSRQQSPEEMLRRAFPQFADKQSKEVKH